METKYNLTWKIKEITIVLDKIYILYEIDWIEIFDMFKDTFNTFYKELWIRKWDYDNIIGIPFEVIDINVLDNDNWNWNRYIFKYSQWKYKWKLGTLSNFIYF